MASLLPNGKQHFDDNNGRPLVGGRVYYYIPNTSTPKNTWQDEAMTILNTNPIILDARGECTAWGEGRYRQVVRDFFGNLIWDKIVTDITQELSEQIEELRDDLAAPDGSDMVGFLQTGTGAVPRTALEKMRERVSPLDYGAVGDGVTDDSDAIERFINSVIDTAKAGDWLSANYTWRITRQLSFSTTNKDLYFEGSGAKIVADFPSHSVAVLDFTMVGGSFWHEGRLDIDASLKANIGLHIHNDQAYNDPALSRPNVYLIDLGVFNCKRINTTFTQSASGIQVQGGMGTVEIVRPRIKQMVLAAGAGVSGSYGAFGISVLNLSAVSYLYCSIQEPEIENVFCEDNTYTVDQDGVRVFDGGERTFRTYPWPSFAEVVGGTYRNCYGRSIKIQAQHCKVRGTNHYRNAGFASFLGNPEIDIQTGGCIVDGVECLYENYVPSRIVQLSSARDAGRITPGMTVQNVKATIIGPNTMTYGVEHTQLVTEPTTISIEGLEIIGRVQFMARLDSRAPGSTFYANRIVGAPEQGCFRSSNSGGVDSVTRLFASQCFNTGSDTGIPFVRRQTASARLIVSATDAIGWLDQRRFSDDDTGSQPGFARINAFGAANNINSGLFRMLAYRIGPGVSQPLPQSAYNGWAALMFISVGHIKESQGLFAISSAGVTAPTAPGALFGSSFGIGDTTEPSTGLYRIWYDPSTTSITVKNTTAEIRTFTIAIFG